MASAWGDVPVVQIELPPCPYCGDLGDRQNAWGPFERSHVRTKTITVDGKRRRLMICVRCSQRFALDAPIGQE